MTSVGLCGINRDMKGTERTHFSTKPRKLVPLVRLTELRVNNGWTHSDLAYRAGIDPKTVRMAEAGFRPGPRVQYAIASQFELKPTELWPIQLRAAA